MKKRIIVLMMCVLFVGVADAMKQRGYQGNREKRGCRGRGGYGRGRGGRGNKGHRSNWKQNSGNYQKKDRGNSPLHNAVMKGDIKKIKQNAKYIFDINNLHQTPLHGVLLAKYYICSVEQKRLSVVSAILAMLQGQDKNKKNDFLNAEMEFLSGSKATALNIAISKGYLGIAKMLVDKGASVDVFDKSSGLYPLHRALLVNGKRRKGLEGELKGLVEKVLEKSNKKWLNKVVFTNAIRTEKDTALNIAIGQGYFGVAKMLIDAGATVDVVDKSSGLYTLHRALLVDGKGRKGFESNLKGLVEKILKKSNKKLEWLNKVVYTNAIRTEKDTALNIAIGQGYFGVTKLLINEGASVDVAGGDGRYPLHRALLVAGKRREGFEGELKGLVGKVLKKSKKKKEWLNKVVYTNAKSTEKAIALNIAISKGYLGIAKLLINEGATVDVFDKSSGLYPLHGALLVNGKGREGFEGELKGLVEKILGKSKKKKEWLNKSVYTNAKCTEEDTALNIAISKGYFGGAKMLIDKGASVDVASSYGLYPLYIAFLVDGKGRKGFESDLKGLVEKILNKSKKKWLNKSFYTNAMHSKKSTVLNIAISKGYLGIAKLLIDKGAFVDVFDKSSGLYPLHIAVINGNAGIFNYLLNCSKKTKIGVDVKDKIKKRSPLQWVTRMVEGSILKRENLSAKRIKLKDAKKMTTELIKSGASLNSKDCEGKNVLHWQIFWGKYKLLETVLKFATKKNNLLEAFLEKCDAYYDSKKKELFSSETPPLEILLNGRCKFRAKETAKVILETKNQEGKTLLEQAMDSKQHELIRQLKQLAEKYKQNKTIGEYLNKPKLKRMAKIISYHEWIQNNKNNYGAW